MNPVGCPHRSRGLLALRTVGDPVDVITGANSDVQRDLTLAGPLPLVWRRHYDSSLAGEPFALGPGHDHEFSCTLRFDVDGMRFEGPLGRTVAFPALLEAGQAASTGGYTLRREEGARFRLSRAGSPQMWFRIADPDRPAPLLALARGHDRVEFRYDGSDRLVGILDSRQRLIDVAHDGRGRVRRVVLRAAGAEKERLLLEYEYDPAGRVRRGRDAYGHSFTFEWDEQDRLVRRTDQRGYAFEFEYDSRGRCTLSRGEDGAWEVRLRYEEGATVVTRGDGGEWTYVHDGGSIARIVDPYGGQRVFTADDAGRIVEESDPNGNIIQWVYGPDGALLAKRSPTGRLLPPDAEGAGVAAPDHRVAACALEWEYGLLVSREAIQRPGRRHLELMGVPSRVRDVLHVALPGAVPDPGLPDLVYDIGGRLVREEFHDGTMRRWTYDAAGNVARIVDRTGGEWRFLRESWNHLAREKDPYGRTISYRWTARDELEAYRRVDGTAAEYVRDLMDRVVEVRRGGRVEARQGWDAAGNLVEKTDGEGELVLRRTIGPGNLLQQRELATGEIHEFEYDERGRIVLMSTPIDVVERAYDDEGRCVAEVRNGLGVAHRYEGGDLRETRVLERFATRYRWEEDGSRRVVDPTGGEHRIRDLGGGVVERAMANGSREFVQFDRSGHVLARVLERPGRVVRWRRWAYDPEGRLHSAEDEDGRTVYGYDAVGRLRLATRDGRAQRFEFDDDDNLVAGPDVPDLEVGDDGRLRRLRGAPVVHDPGGRAVGDVGPTGPRSLGYDSRGMLTHWRTGAGEGRAWFDPLGRRTAVEGEGGRTEFVWDGDRVAATITDGASVRVFVYAAPLALTPIAFVDYASVDADPSEGAVRAVFCEQRAAPDRIEDAQGRVVWSAQVRPFGEARVDPESRIAWSLRLPGHWHDPDTGLHYNRFRSYDPTIGRYTGPDPEGVRGGLNLYAYTANPLAEVDVRGLHCPDHPAGRNPDCEDCLENEVTQIRNRPPQPPDPATVERCGPPAGVMTGNADWPSTSDPYDPRPRERPYRHPPEIYRVRPGEPLDVGALDPTRTYLWAVDREGNVWVAPEHQDGFGRVVKHGDLIPGDNPDRMRGEGRVGGELKHDRESNEWVMDDNSSYSFARLDDRRGNSDNVAAAHDLLTQSGTDTSDIVVKSPPPEMP